MLLEGKNAVVYGAEALSEPTSSPPGTSSASRRGPAARTPCVTTPRTSYACSCTRPCAPRRHLYPDSDKIAVWTGNEDDNLIVRGRNGSTTGPPRRRTAERDHPQGRS
jgi:hypothetical protein